MESIKKQLTRALGTRVKEIRRGLNMSQREFAARMGLSNTHLSEVELGRSGPGFYFFYQLLKYHNVSPLYLLLGKEPVFMEEERGEQQPKNQEPEPSPRPGSVDFAENTELIREMLDDLGRSPVVRFAVLGFYSRFIIENKEIIAEDIAKNAVHQGSGPQA